jgi:hypothetical protein
MEAGVQFLWLTNGVENRLWNMSTDVPSALDQLPGPETW